MKKHCWECDKDPKFLINNHLKTFNKELYLKHTHPSETSLDDHLFRYNIDNNGTLEELLSEVKLVYDLINKKDGTNTIF